jgi:uncharacterized membrane protein
MMDRGQVIARLHWILLALIAFSIVGLGVAALLLRLGLPGVFVLPLGFIAALLTLIVDAGSLQVFLKWPRR